MAAFESDRTEVSSTAMEEAGRHEMKLVAMAIEIYRGDVGSYPPNLEALIGADGPPGWNGPYVNRMPPDPWGRPYRYAVDEDGYTLTSLGPDGLQGTDDDVSSGTKGP
jgi:general secretion pathway protein G